jgi:cell division protein FtsL
MKSMMRSGSMASLVQGYVELLFFLPFVLTAAVYTLGDSAVWPWSVSLGIGYWAGSAIIGAKPIKRRIYRLLLSAGLGLFLTVLTFFLVEQTLSPIPVVICSLIGAVFAYRGMASTIRGWFNSFPNSQLLTAVCVYIAVQPLKLFLLKELSSYNVVLICCGIATVILFFFIANERHIGAETADTGKSKTTLDFKRQNRLWIGLLLVVIAIITMFRQIQHAVERFIKQIIDSIMEWMNRPRENEVQSEPPSEAPAPALPQSETKPPADWVVLLEQILKIAATVLVIVVVCFLLYYLGKKLYRLVQSFISKIWERSADRQGDDANYSDEVESLMSYTKLKDQLNGSLRRLSLRGKDKEPGWQDLKSNAERIRYLYKKLLSGGMKTGYTVIPSLTPRETAADMAKKKQTVIASEHVAPLIDVYEAVRYGDKSPSDETVAELKRKLDIQ